MTTKARIAVIAIALFALFAGVLHAEESVVLARGFKPNSVFQQNEFDSVNTFNGNLMLNVPLGQAYKSNGLLAYQFSLSYNSHVWDLYYYTGIDYGSPGSGPRVIYWSYYNVNGIQYWYPEVSRPVSTQSVTPPSGNVVETGGGGVSGVESVPHGNAGMGWVFGLGTFDGTAYTSQEGTTSLFYSSLHGPDANPTATVKYTNDGTYLRLRTLANDASGRPQREIDFPDGLRKHFTCAFGCPNAQIQTWNLDWISDPFGNVLFIDYNTPGAISGQTWKWTMTEMTLNNAEAPNSGQQYYNGGSRQAYLTVRTHYAYFSRPKPWETRLDKLAVAAPNGRYAIYDFKYSDMVIPGTVGIPWPDMSGIVARYDVQSSGGSTYYRRTASALNAVLLPDPAGVTSPATPPSGPGTSTAGVWQFRYYDDPNGYPGDPAPVDYGNHKLYPVSYLSGRVRVAKPPTGGGYRYEYGPRGYPTSLCRPRDGETHGVAFTGISKRQQLDANENDVPNAAWFYVGHGWLRTADLGGQCLSAKEFVAAVIAPPTDGTKSRISFAFFTLRSLISDVGFGHLGWPYTEQEMLCDDGSGNCNGQPDAKYLSTRTAWGNYADFTADPDDSVRRIFPRYLRANDTPVTVTPLRSTYVRYESSHDECPDGDAPSCTSSNLRKTLDRQVFHDDGDTYSETVLTAFDGLGHFRTIQTTGNFQQTTGPNLPLIDRTEDRLAVTTWNPGVNYVPGVTLPSGAPNPNQAWFLEKYATTTVSENGVTFSKQYDFDGDRNFIRSVRSLTNTNGNPAASGTDVLVKTDRTGQFDGTVRVRQSWLGGDTADLSDPTYVKDTVLRYGSPEYQAYLDCNVGAPPFLILQESVVDKNTGLATSIADSTGAMSFYSYDALSRVATVTPPGATSVAQVYSYHYATQGRSGIEGPNALPAYTDSTLGITRGGGADLTYSFDFLGRHIRLDEKLPGSGTNWTKFDYLTTGLLFHEKTPIPGSPNESTTTHSYDVLDRETLTLHPDGTKREFQYGGIRLTSTKNDKVAIGDTGLSTVWTSEMRDVFGRTRRVNDNAARADYRYDPGDHLIRVDLNDNVTDINQVRWFNYDGRGFLTSETIPELGPGTIQHQQIDPAGHSEVLHYVSDSSLDLNFTFDKAERLIRVRAIHPPISGSPAWVQQFVYHPQNGSTVPPGEFAAGKLFKALRRNFVPKPNNLLQTMWVDVRKIYGYDDAGRVASVKLESPYNGTFSAMTTYHYDALGQVSQIDYPSITGSNSPNRTITQTFSRGRITALTAGGRTNWSIATFGYHSNGMLSTITRSRPGLSVSLVDAIDVDPSGMKRPSRYSWDSLDANQTKVTADSGLYLYDGASDIHQIGDDKYRYDSSYRLVKATVDNRSRTWGYDGYGNITSRPDGSDASVPFTVSTATNHQAGLQYDKLGNVTQMPDTRPGSTSPLNFKYDLLSSMTNYDANGIGRIFLYDADGERVATIDYKAPGGLIEHWYVRGLKNQVLRDYDRSAGTWSWVKDYIYRDTALVSTVGANESLRDVHVDHLGSTKFVTGLNGRAVGIGSQTDSIRKYWPFGELLITRALPERQFFTGHERDDDGTDYASADLDYMHARYYTPVGGRFLSLDRVSGTAARPQTWNRYGYVANNPLNSTDPTGDVQAKLFGTSINVEPGFVAVLSFGENSSSIGHVAMVTRIDEKGNAWVVDLQPIDSKLPSDTSKVLADRRSQQLTEWDSNQSSRGGRLGLWTRDNMTLLGAVSNHKPDGGNYTAADVKSRIDMVNEHGGMVYNNQYEGQRANCTPAGTCTGDCASAVDTLTKLLQGKVDPSKGDRYWNILDWKDHIDVKPTKDN